MSKLNLSAYQEYAQRTLPDLGSVEDNLMHMSLGLITEVGELTDAFKRKLAYKKEIDIVNCAEEIGDIMWYTVNAMTLISFKADPVGPFGKIVSSSNYEYPLSCIPDLVILASTSSRISHILCLKESGRIHGIYLKDFEAPLWNILKVCNGLCDALSLDIEEIMFKNIEKLKVRFPEKFSEDAALNRDLDKERAVLEKGE